MTRLSITKSVIFIIPLLTPFVISWPQNQDNSSLEYEKINKFTTQYYDYPYSKDDIKILGYDYYHLEPARFYADSAAAFSIIYLKTNDEKLKNKINTILKSTSWYLTNYSPTIRGETGWGTGKESYWGSPMTDYSLTLTIFLLKNSLDKQMLDEITTALINEANYWAGQNPEKGLVDDTKAEENALIAAFLAMATNTFSENENAKLWDTKAKYFAINSLSKDNLHQNFILANHNYTPHPLYACSTASFLAHGALTYKLVHKEFPKEFSFNVTNVLKAHETYINPTSWQLQNCQLATDFNGKDDWGLDATVCNSSYSFAALIEPEYFKPVYKRLLQFEKNVTITQKPDFLNAAIIIRHVVAHLLQNQ